MVAEPLESPSAPGQTQTVETMIYNYRANRSRVEVYLDNGLVFEYHVDDPMKGREHAAAIIAGGYRHTPFDSEDLVWYPPHRIHQVKVERGGETSKYRDTTRAT